MIKVIYNYPQGWKYKDVYREKSNLTKDGLLYEIKSSYHLDGLLRSKCNYLEICGEVK